ncbi:hypothetical protein DN752_19420 [Echinicola strongylocentroti]|uniref:Uncharacterized protein n=1 Tax=Echinicola strongylocentroti TaxID=1795355 RepID=A0A2Z4IP63_9BACT|nr:hypothetical protein [Echinicola strongylocentroti]AWW32133.1 hypothetical protein DN752_19420 [Echinicola strongylocentroti]
MNYLKHIKALPLLLCLSACTSVDYDWEKFKLAGTPRVTLDTEASALPTFQTAKVSFFDMSQPNYASDQQFEWSLDYYDQEGRVEVTEIQVYLGFYKAESTVPAYPIVLSHAEVNPTESQFPLPSIIEEGDMLFDQVTEFPKSYSFTASELADLVGMDLSEIGENDYFLFKFTLTMSDGTTIVTYNYKDCDEARGERCDCRVGARFKNAPEQ